MIEAVFISDLHLHPEEPAIQARFDAFIDWVKNATKTVYILGDFFHAWPGDDALDNWSLGIAKQIASLKEQGIEVYYMHGNRDFLLGKKFAAIAQWKILLEPTLIQLGEESVLLVHGDRYCTLDKAHQRFRKITRNNVFCAIFTHIPLRIRKKLVNVVRNHSEKSNNKPIEYWDVVQKTFIKHMQKHETFVLIHGHTHKPDMHTYTIKDKKYTRIVLSDWDDNPLVLCYDSSNGFYFNHNCLAEVLQNG